MATVLDFFEPYSAEITGGREPAQVLLLHANSLNQAWYPQIHALYLARGYRFVPLEAALADPIYQPSLTPIVRGQRRLVAAPLDPDGRAGDPLGAGSRRPGSWRPMQGAGVGTSAAIAAGQTAP